MSTPPGGADGERGRRIGFKGKPQLTGHPQPYITTRRSKGVGAQHVTPPQAGSKAGLTGVIDIEPEEGDHERFSLPSDHHVLLEDASGPSHAGMGSEAVDPMGVQDAAFLRQDSELRIQAGEELLHQFLNAIERTQDRDHGGAHGGHNDH